MATLSAYGRADEIAELYRTIDDHAHAIARAAGADEAAAGDGSGTSGTNGTAAHRPIDGLRMDALLALVRAGAGGTGASCRHDTDGAGADGAGAGGGWRRGEAAVVIDLPTLLHLADHSGEIPGYGPIVPSLARAMAGDRAWRRWVADPVQGHLLDHGRTTYRPPVRLRAFVTARDRTCRFPRCGQPGYRCDIDHTHPYHGGGATSAANCRSLCRRHHRLKTHHGWHLEAHRDGSCTWTSPTGHTYLVRPPPATPA